MLFKSEDEISIKIGKKSIVRPFQGRRWLGFGASFFHEFHPRFRHGGQDIEKFDHFVVGGK
ncbi:hypothetical protein SAMN05421761_1221 [Belliella pelovolcani]|uniref:Uncharacterized protein n=1 Tax=Belliella pelovolcani TaxID=529505 RepID=A0A1N7PWG2_9BACT|nr:hypothetical protein SAMN05421761_1221 [Belliella pelovolcani]